MIGRRCRFSAFLIFRLLIVIVFTRKSRLLRLPLGSGLYRPPKIKYHRRALHLIVLCYGILTNPTDAYEWSFVAVPAQRKAGVTKSFFKEEHTLQKGIDILKSMTEDTVLTVNQAAEIKEYIAALEELSSEALTYKKHLTEEIQRYALIIMPKVDTKQFTQGCSFMNLSELRCLRDGLKKQAGEILPPSLQLRASVKESNNNNNAFKI